MKIIRFKMALTYAIIDGTKTETRRLLGEKEYNIGDIAAIASHPFHSMSVCIQQKMPSMLLYYHQP